MAITTVSILTGFCNPSAVKPTERVVLANTEQIPNSVARYLEHTLCAYNTLINKMGDFRFYETVAWRTGIFCIKCFLDLGNRGRIESSQLSAMYLLLIYNSWLRWKFSPAEYNNLNYATRNSMMVASACN